MWAHIYVFGVSLEMLGYHKNRSTNVCLCPTAPSQESYQADELQEVKGQLHTTEQKNAELTEQLKNTNANLERYRVVVLTLEETVKKEKEVLLQYKNVCVQLDSFLMTII